MSETFTALYALCIEGDIRNFYTTQGGKHLYVLAPGLYDATPENIPHRLPPTHPDRERSRRIDAALSGGGYRYVGPKWEHNDHSAVLWQHFIYSH
jgi:hypothetical protein